MIALEKSETRPKKSLNWLFNMRERKQRRDSLSSQQCFILSVFSCLQNRFQNRCVDYLVRHEA